MAKRRERGEGGIYKRAADGLFVGSLDLGIDPKTKKRKRRVVYGRTRGEIKEKLNAIGVEIGKTGQTKKPTRLTLAEFLQGWLDKVISRNRQPTTLRSYQGIVDGHISGKYGIGHFKLLNVTPEAILDFYERLRKHDAGDRTVQLVHAVLRRALGHALRQELIPRNPASLVDSPTYEPTSMQPLSTTQISKFLAAAKGDRLEALFVLAVLSGARQGELFALSWRDFDPEHGAIHVQSSQQDVNGKVSIAKPKTKSSRRQVYLPKVAVNAMLKHRDRAIAEKLPVGPDDRIFTSPGGGPLRRSNMLQRSFKPLLDKAEIPRAVRFHDLRHSYATELFSSEVDAKIIQSQLGHSKISTTLDIYAHLRTSLAKGAASKLDDTFGPSKKKAKGKR